MRLKPGGTWWRTGGEVKGKLAKGEGSQYSHTTSKRGVSSITNADAHISAASSRLNWPPCRFKWTRPFLRETKSGFCACAITFQTHYTWCVVYLCSSRQLRPFAITIYLRHQSPCYYIWDSIHEIQISAGYVLLVTYTTPWLCSERMLRNNVSIHMAQRPGATVQHNSFSASHPGPADRSALLFISSWIS